MRLFAQQGYARTTVAQLEEAVGLSPGAGGLYRHFPSKQAVLEGGIEAALAVSDKVRGQVEELPRDNPRRALASVAEATLRLLEWDRDVTAILFKDLDQFPALRDRVRDRWIQASYETFADILRHTGAAGGDVQATAVVALGSLVLYHVLQVVLGEPPGRVPEERFLKAWLNLVAPADGATAGGSKRKDQRPFGRKR